MMNRNDEQALVHLGKASAETKGTFGVIDDHKGALIPPPGLSAE